MAVVELTYNRWTITFDGSTASLITGWNRWDRDFAIRHLPCHSELLLAFETLWVIGKYLVHIQNEWYKELNEAEVKDLWAMWATKAAGFSILSPVKTHWKNCDMKVWQRVKEWKNLNISENLRKKAMLLCFFEGRGVAKQNFTSKLNEIAVLS